MTRVHTRFFVLTLAASIILIAWLSLATVDLKAQSATFSGGGPWPAPVEATGQQLCYDPSALTTDVIPCAGTGQDGESQLGVAWPAQRFTDNLDGSVTDNLTGLIWLEDASCFQALRWDASFTLASNLAAGQCSLTDGSQAGD